MILRRGGKCGQIRKEKKQNEETVLPMSAMAEKENEEKTVSEVSLTKATDSELSRKEATPSNVKPKVEETEEEEDDRMVLTFENDGVGKVTFLYTVEVLYTVEGDRLSLEREEGGFEEVVLEKDNRLQ